MSASKAYQYRVSGIVLGFVFFLTACRSFGTSRIGGTYIAHGTDYVSMLELTEGKDGQISGTVTVTTLKSDGQIASETKAIKGGTLDGDELTLSLSGLFGSSLFSPNVEGNLIGSGVRIQTIESNGSLLSWVYYRSTLSEFKIYTDQLKSRGETIILNLKFLKAAQGLLQTVHDSEDWVSNAELHDQRIPKAKDAYQKIEAQMQSLLLRERRTPHSVAREALAIDVNQGDIAGTQLDLQVNQIWDSSIGDSGEDISKRFANYPSDCGNSGELAQKGITQQNSEMWLTACQQALDSGAKFRPIYKKIMEDRSDLESFQTSAQAHRKELVQQAMQLQ